tara:strand:+ start:1159 stop:1428 length:270 start_codon:yes stop_codon:yes gene_type:complete
MTDIIKFIPPNPEIYCGNELIISAELINTQLEENQYTFKWRSNNSFGLPEEFAGIMYGESITIHPFFSLNYTVQCLDNETNNIISENKY